MNDDDDKRPDEPSTYQGVKIEKLPTVGRPLTLKGSRWRGNYVTTRLRKGHKKKLKEVVKALGDS